MTVLGHIHTFNDEDVIERSLQAVLDQTYPIQEILIVDNGSADGTLKRSFPDHVTVIRHPENLGTSGAVVTGMQYALEKGYDWIWVLDADSAPQGDALESLLELYRSFGAELQTQTWLLASLPVEASSQKPCHGIIFTERGYRQIRPDPQQLFYECDFTIWSGSLFKMDAVRKIGLPPQDYLLDWGEFAYGYLAKQAGYRAFAHQRSIVEHNIGGQAALHFTSYQLGPFSLRMRELPPTRCYYLVRNLLYFWIYEYKARNFYTLSFSFIKISKLIGSFIVRPATHLPQLFACLRGVWDGLCGNLHHRY
jgi:GT2 family glycosyltransferase